MKNTLTEMKNTLKGTNSGFDEAKRHKIFKMMKVKDLQPRLLYAERLSFRIKERERERKSFPDKKKLKEFITTKPVSQEMLKG